LPIQLLRVSARYILESASKEFRTSTVNTADSGGSAVTSLNITNANGETVDYRFSSNKLQRQVNGGGWQDLNPADLELTGGFYVRKSTFPDRTAVTLAMKVKSTGGRVETQKEIYVQSTVAPR
jgi:menaquinone-dependent protoporphyrinogen IX oxidase